MTKITSKGQVTIPQRLRDHLGLEPGSSVEFELARGRSGFSGTTAADAEEQICSSARECPIRHHDRRHHGPDARRRRGVILVDTNVLLDLVTDDPDWAGWSQQQLDHAAGVLPDFFIGAHAVIAGAMLMTRDAARYRGYFPGIVLIASN